MTTSTFSFFVEPAGAAGELLVLECHQVVALHHAVNDVRLADEVGDELVDGVAVDLGRRTDLLDSPAFMTTILSDIVSASSWSWVTKMKVMPTSC